MIGIRAIAAHIPEGRSSNLEKLERFGVDQGFLDRKIGVLRTSRMAPEDRVPDLCARAFDALRADTGLAPSDVDCVLVVTQNPGRNIPHVSAELHGMLGLPEDCAVFDVSLGCSGWVHGLSIATSFMAANGMATGLLFTCDPYSRVLNEDDKNTSLLFGDAAAVTLLTDDPLYLPGAFDFGTQGRMHMDLALDGQGLLTMNGRSIFDFACKRVPASIDRVLERNGLAKSDIDRFVLHQASRFMVEVAAQRAGLDGGRTPFVVRDYGNTVSSSIPIALGKELIDPGNRHILVCGFGVGLAWATTILTRKEDGQ